MKSLIIIYSESYNSRYSEEAYFFSDVLKGDSIVVNYENEKKQVFYCFRNNNSSDEGCNESRNILSQFEDSSGDPEGGIIFNRYTFSSADFENAISYGENGE